jgi:Domain of unknown function (DUF4124)
MTGRANLRRVPAVLIVLLSLHTPISFAQVYRWVDSSGKVHYGEVVPERYKAGARLVTGGTPDPTPAQTREAQERAARDKLEAAERERARNASAPSAARPAQATESAGTSCEAEWKKFAESNECYSPYLFRGGVKPEGAEKCGPAVAAPTCGPAPAKPTPDRTY